MSPPKGSGVEGRGKVGGAVDPGHPPEHLPPPRSTPAFRRGSVADDLQARADALLDEALAAAGARDPREFYRTRLRDLRDRDRTAYDRAVAYYRDELLPAIVGGAEPLAAWSEYGRTLAELHGPGRTVAVDASGAAAPYTSPPDPDHLVLHLPDAAREPALLVGLPLQLSGAQRATYDWLVQGRNRLREGEE